jgi:hypothetical protein
VWCLDHVIPSVDTVHYLEPAKLHPLLLSNHDNLIEKLLLRLQAGILDKGVLE